MTERPRAGDPEPPSLRLAGRALVVDDEPANVLLLTRLLQRAGMTVHPVTDPRQALEAFGSDVDLVLLDYAMPHVDGLTLLRLLAERVPDGQFVPIVMLTADTTRDTRNRALAGGASDFLLKPFERTEVLLRAGNLLEMRRMRQAEAQGRARLEELVAARTRELADERGFLQAVVRSLDVGLVACDADGRIRVANAAANRLGVRPDQVGPRAVTPHRLRDAAGAVLPADADPLTRAWSGIDVDALELRSIGGDGNPLVVSVNAHQIDSEHGERIGAVLAVHDVTEQRAAEEQLRRVALHDPLTDLPNRALMDDRLAQSLARHRRGGGGLGVLFVDLDDFKYVNDTLGHAAGDAVLVAVAHRLAAVLRTSDTAARFGGDEFVVLAELIGPPEPTAELLAGRLLDALRQPVSVAGVVYTPSASIGITVVGAEDTRSAGEVLSDADAAMFAAKESGGTRWVVFDPRLRTRMAERLAVESAVRGALAAGELRLHYQPTIDLRSGVVTGSEALVRWQRPQVGLVGPDTFIPTAEQTDLIVEIGSWVLAEACRQLAAWQRVLPGSSFTVAVNVAARQVMRPDFVATVTDALMTTGAPAHRLCLELTESTLISDPARVAVTLQQLRALGVRVAVDDFGAGHSSLHYLQALPVDVVKVDRSFVAGLPDSGPARAIVSYVVELTRELGVVSLAEGVETTEQAQQLAELGCQMAQGWLYCKAVPPEDFSRLLASVGVPS